MCPIGSDSWEILKWLVFRHCLTFYQENRYHAFNFNNIACLRFTKKHESIQKI